HRLTGDVEADPSTQAVLFPFGRRAARVARLHEAVVVAAMPHALAAAEARHLAQHVRAARGELEDRVDDIHRTSRGERGHRQRRKLAVWYRERFLAASTLGLARGGRRAGIRRGRGRRRRRRGLRGGRSLRRRRRLSCCLLRRRLAAAGENERGRRDNHEWWRKSRARARHLAILALIIR